MNIDDTVVKVNEGMTTQKMLVFEILLQQNRHTHTAIIV